MYIVEYQEKLKTENGESLSAIRSVKTQDLKYAMMFYDKKVEDKNYGNVKIKHVYTLAERW